MGHVIYQDSNRVRNIRFNHSTSGVVKLEIYRTSDSTIVDETKTLQPNGTTGMKSTGVEFEFTNPISGPFDFMFIFEKYAPSKGSSPRVESDIKFRREPGYDLMLCIGTDDLRISRSQSLALYKGFNFKFYQEGGVDKFEIQGKF